MTNEDEQDSILPVSFDSLASTGLSNDSDSTEAF